MTKISAVILTLAMLLCLGAAAPSPENGEGLSGELIGEVPVNAFALTSLDAGEYSVTVAWDDLSYEYEFTSLGTWNPESHTYDGDASGEWVDKSPRTITITNESDPQITATLSVAFDGDAGVEYEIESDSEYVDGEDSETVLHLNGYGTGGQSTTGWFYVTLTSVNPSSLASPLDYFDWVDGSYSESEPKVFGVITITLVATKH